MYFYYKTKKEMLSNLQDINWYLDIEGPGGKIKVIPMTWYKKYKPSIGYYSIAYSNPNRKGYMIVYGGKVLVEELTAYKAYQAIGDMAYHVGNGADFDSEKNIERFFQGYKPW